MIGMEYHSYQCYSYQNLKELQEIIKVDGIGIMNIDEDEQIIEYYIDRSKCIRLSDLIYMINSNFVRFHLGQLLHLFNKLLKKVISLQQKNLIQHSYLDENRIWLILQNQSPPISAVYTKIDYEIAFTGYQCQLYEKRSSIAIPADEKIQNIIKVILEKFKKNNIFFHDSLQLEIENFIYDPIIKACDKHEIIFTLYQIHEIYGKYGFDYEQQTIHLDMQVEDSKVDFERKQNLLQYVKDYIYALKDETSFILEFIILTEIQNMTAPLENSQCKFKKIEKDNYYVKALKLIQEENNIKLKNQIERGIQQIVVDTLQKMLEYYKFEISEEEKQELNESVINRILNLKLNQYFYNSPHYHLEIGPENLFKQQSSLQSKFIQQIVNEEVKWLISYHILLLIYDLI